MPVDLEAVVVGFSLDGAEVPTADVRRLRYVEGLSELCEADVTVALPRADATMVLPGTKAAITFGRGLDGDPEATRWICGVIRSVEQVDQGDGMSLERPLLRIGVVPRVWRASLARRTRAFRDGDYDAVIRSTAKLYGPDPDGAMPVKKAPLIVQYEETDLAFMLRLLEETGFTHVVEHTGSGDTWRVFEADPDRTRSQAARPLRWTILASGQSSEAGVVRAGRAGAMATRTHVVSDADRRKKSAAVGSGTAAREGEAFTWELREPVGAETAATFAARAADEQRPQRERFWLETSDVALRPGERVEAELSRADAEGGVSTELLVVRVEHEVETSAEDVVYRNRAEAVTYAKPFRPARVTPRPRVTAPQTGVVVAHVDGPGKTSLEVDVLMDWSDEEHAIVLPVRLAMPLAGADHGAVILPHLKTEVLVHFVDGVPERPVLLGALYHQEAKAVTGSEAGGGMPFVSRLVMLGKRGPTNVIEVDDSTGQSETVKMLAINDVAVKVGRNEERDVEGTYREAIKGDVTVDLGARRTTHVQADETYETDGKVSITVLKTGRVLVNQSLQMTADTRLSLISGNTRADFSPSAAKITVGGTVIEATAAALKLTVGGTAVELTASGVKLSIGAASVELNPAQVKIAGAMVDLNDGALQVI